MSYIYNPKMAGSGLIACIPQTGRCPNNCSDCFFQSGRSYLEPFEENLPNMPTMDQVGHRVVRVNDGNDSNVDRDIVTLSTERYPLKFYNTAIPDDLEGFGDPVVLTINPGKMTDGDAYFIDPVPKNLMFVRFRINTWNLFMADGVIKHYSERKVPTVLTFMAYFDTKIREGHEDNYIFRKRTLNSYWAVTTATWAKIMDNYKHNKWVSSCGKIEGELGTTACRHCGNCLREFFTTLERMEE